MRPRKGTKTLSWSGYSESTCLIIYKDETPEGDENRTPSYCKSGIHQIYKDETPEGDENSVFLLRAVRLKDL